MSSTTVAEFANELKKSTATLLEQLKAAGVPKTQATDPVTEADKHSLLNYLHTSHGTATSERKKITLVKKQTTEIKQADASGKARTIQVEVRKKRTFIRRDEGVEAEAPAPVEAAAPVPGAPWPITVWQQISVGRPSGRCACSRAARSAASTAAGSCPSTRGITCQP